MSVTTKVKLQCEVDMVEYYLINHVDAAHYAKRALERKHAKSARMWGRMARDHLAKYRKESTLYKRRIPY